MDVKLTSVAELERQNLPQTLKAKIAAKSRAIGSGYERSVAKRISAYFGFKWTDAFLRTQPHGHLQPDGDIKTINEMKRIWDGAGLGPIECKKRREWSFDQLFKNVNKSKVFEYWQHSNDQTKTLNSVVIFSRPGAPDYVFCRFDGKIKTDRTCLVIQAETETFVIQTLESFLKDRWPEPQSLL